MHDLGHFGLYIIFLDNIFQTRFGEMDMGQAYTSQSQHQQDGERESQINARANANSAFFAFWQESKPSSDTHTLLLKLIEGCHAGAKPGSDR